jgi:AcrR family transcriptional regulator
MTLDAVAAKAGVSKGGLLHHFPNKVALLVAMVKRQINMHQESLKKILDEIPEGPSRELKGFILSILYRERDRDNLGASLSAAVAHDPRLNEPVRKVVAETYARFASSDMSFEKAAVIALAADGLWLQEMLSISPFTEKQRVRIINELLGMTDEKAPDRERGRKK